MKYVLSDRDNRHQVTLDQEIPVYLKLSCGAVSGATAQSSENCIHFGI